MIAVDTNVVVRLLTQDDPEQFHHAVKLFTAETIFLPDTVMLETEWVLRYAYDFQPTQINAAFRKLLGLPNVEVRDSTSITLAIEWYEKGLDFADAFHLAQSLHCRQIATFDGQLVRGGRQFASPPVRLLN